MTARDELTRLLAKTADVPRLARGKAHQGRDLTKIYRIRREAVQVHRGKCAAAAAQFGDLHDDDEIFIATVVKVTGKGRASIAAYIKRGTFPEPSRRIRAPGMPSLSRVWRVGDVRAWLAG